MNRDIIDLIACLLPFIYLSLQATSFTLEHRNTALRDGECFELERQKKFRTLILFPAGVVMMVFYYVSYWNWHYIKLVYRNFPFEILVSYSIFILGFVNQDSLYVSFNGLIILLVSGALMVMKGIRRVLYQKLMFSVLLVILLLSLVSIEMYQLRCEAVNLIERVTSTLQILPSVMVLKHTIHLLVYKDCEVFYTSRRDLEQENRHTVIRKLMSSSSSSSDRLPSNHTSSDHHGLATLDQRGLNGDSEATNSV